VRVDDAFSVAFQAHIRVSPSFVTELKRDAGIRYRATRKGCLKPWPTGVAMERAIKVSLASDRLSGAVQAPPRPSGVVARQGKGFPPVKWLTDSVVRMDKLFDLT
jgi:hypothetical protein